MRIASSVSFNWTLLLLGSLFNIQNVCSQTPTASTAHSSRIKQPIHHPTSDDVLTAGSTFSIEWEANLNFTNVTIELWDKTTWGFSRDFGTLCYHWVNPFCGTIVTHAPNTGSYLWNVPKPGSDFPRGQKLFWIKMYVDDYLKPEIGNTIPVLAYSQSFAFAPEPGQVVVPMESPVAALVNETEELPGSVSSTSFGTATSNAPVAGTPSASFTGPVAQKPKKTATQVNLSPGVLSKLKTKLPTACLVFMMLI